VPLHQLKYSNSILLDLIERPSVKSYKDMLHYIIQNGESHNDRTGVGTTSVFGYQWRHRMSTGFPLLTVKRTPLRWVAEELRWFLSGSSDENELRAQGVDIWAEWATAEKCAKFGREPGQLGPIYGPQMRAFGPDGVDQIERLMHELSTNPQSRRHVVSLWDPATVDQVELPACHTLYQVKCHGETGISLHLYCRSIDAFLGFPFDVASYGLLLKLLAHATKRVARDLIISFGDLHIYDNHRWQVGQVLEREPRPLPFVNIAEHATIFDWTWEDISLTGYHPHPSIKADVAI
jgi:thymidylate synthase